MPDGDGEFLRQPIECLDDGGAEPSVDQVEGQPVRVAARDGGRTDDGEGGAQ